MERTKTPRAISIIVARGRKLGQNSTRGTSGITGIGRWLTHLSIRGCAPFLAVSCGWSLAGNLGDHELRCHRLFPIPCSLFPAPCSLFPVLKLLAYNFPPLAHNPTMFISRPSLVSVSASAVSLWPHRRCRTMVLTWEKVEGAGAKEIRSKGEENSGTPTPPTFKTQFLRGVNQCKCKIINIFINMTYVLISKHKPQKIIVFWPKITPFLPVLCEKKPFLSTYS